MGLVGQWQVGAIQQRLKYKLRRVGTGETQDMASWTNWTLTVVLASISLALVGRAMLYREKFFEYPFLVSAIFVVFILPQLPGLAQDPYLPADAYAKTLAFTISCLLACWAGWNSSRKPFKSLAHGLDQRTLSIGAILLSIVGSIFYYQLSRQRGELIVGAGLTGLPVMQVFFSRLLVYGLGIAVLCFARRPSLLTGVIICYDAVFYLHRIVITGKRGEAFEFIILIVLAIWFQRGRIVLPRTAVAVGLLVGALVMNSVGDYRDITRDERRLSVDTISEISLLENFEKGLERGGMEMRNAVYLINYADSTMQFDYGLFHWNVLVFNFVPAQVVGQGFKNSLSIQMAGLQDRNYNPWFGTTETGMSDSFVSFWYFGFVKFLLIAYLLARIYRTAIAGGFAAQLVYMFSATPATHTISHQTQWLFSAWVDMALFLLPVLLLAHRRREVGLTHGVGRLPAWHPGH